MSDDFLCFTFNTTENVPSPSFPIRRKSTVNDEIPSSLDSRSMSAILKVVGFVLVTKILSLIGSKPNMNYTIAAILFSVSLALFGYAFMEMRKVESIDIQAADKTKSTKKQFKQTKGKVDKVINNNKDSKLKAAPLNPVITAENMDFLSLPTAKEDEEEEWTAVKSKVKSLPQSRSTVSKSVPTISKTEETDTQRRNKRKAEKAKELKSLLASQQEVRLREFKKSKEANYMNELARADLMRQRNLLLHKNSGSKSMKVEDIW